MSLGTFSSFIKNISEFTNFNPHGFGRAPDGTLVVTNYILPSSLLAPTAADLVFRDTVVSISSTGHLQVYLICFLFIEAFGVIVLIVIVFRRPIPCHQYLLKLQV